MIKINVFNQADFDKLLAVKAASDSFFAQRETLSVSGRRPELLKMFNCKVCGNRHRKSHTCVQNYVAEADGIRKPNTRILRHRNAWGLQVLERATQIYNREMSYYPNILLDDPEWTEEEKKNAQEFRDKIGKQSLSAALNKLRSNRAQKRKKKNRTARNSRRINRAA